jgi:hypothetical protein
MSAGLLTSTVTPGSTAPDVSLTVPAIALVCADAIVGVNANPRAIRAAVKNNRAKLRIPISLPENQNGGRIGRAN